MKVLLIDNFDSFTFNLYQLVGSILDIHQLSTSLTVKRNNDISLAEIKKSGYDRIIISPGPGHPGDPAYFGVCRDVILEVAQTVPTLGVCLGLQGIAHYYGGRVVRASQPMHGKTSRITHTDQGIFKGLPQNLEVMRYHSLIVEASSLPASLAITAEVSDNRGAPQIMGLRHRQYPLEGVQFHPESFATESGREMMTNFITNSERKQ